MHPVLAKGRRLESQNFSGCPSMSVRWPCRYFKCGGSELILSDSCALSLQPFKNPVAVVAEPEEGVPPRADVFDLLNIVPYIRKFKTSRWPSATLS